MDPKNSKTKKQSQSWGEWIKEHPPSLRADVNNKKGEALPPDIIKDIFYRIIDSPTQAAVRSSFKAEQARLEQVARQGRFDAVNAERARQGAPPLATNLEPEINGFARYINNLTQLQDFYLSLSCTFPLHSVVTLNGQLGSYLHDPTNLQMIAYTLSFHPAWCERFKLFGFFGPEVTATPYFSGSLKGSPNQSFGINLSTLPKNSNLQNAETVTNDTNISGTGSEEIPSASNLSILEKDSLSFRSRLRSRDNINKEGTNANKQAGDGFSSSSQKKETSPLKIPAIFEKQFEWVPHRIVELILPALRTLDPYMRKVHVFKSMPSTKVSYACVGTILIIIRLGALRISKRNKIKKKKNSSLLLFIINHTTNLSSLSISFCCFSLAHDLVRHGSDYSLSTFLYCFEKSSPFFRLLRLHLLIKIGVHGLRSLPIITVNSVVIGPWDIVLFDLAKAFFGVILGVLTLACSATLKTIILNSIERSLSFFIDRFCLWLSNFCLWLRNFCLWLYSPFSKKQNIENAKA